MIRNKYKKISLTLTTCLLWAGGIHGQMAEALVAAGDLDLNTVIYIEDEEIIDVDFDTYFHLPENFNPYQGMILELKDIIYLENDDETILDSRPSSILP